MSKVSTYKDLIAWQKGISLVTDIYSLTKSFPAEERYGLVSQLNRAVVSVPANIAEGWGRESLKNYLQFLRTSRGSLYEVETLIIISHNLKLCASDDFSRISIMIEEVSKILSGLIKSLESKLKSENIQ